MSTLSVKEYAFKKSFDFIRVGGESAPPEQAKARKEVCVECPFFGVVEPIKGLKMDGCTKCGCPSATKPHMKTLPRLKDKEGTPLTITEMLELKIAGNLIEEELYIQTIKCPHPEGNKWADVDNNFN